MSAPTTPADLLDLKMMPAWVNEPAQANDYSAYSGEEERPFGREGRGPQRGRDSRPRPPRSREQREGGGGGRRPERGGERRRPEGEREERRPPREAAAPLPQVGVHFLPHAPAFESVMAQIKSGTVAYSVFALARLFLDKPERYDVRLAAVEGAVLHQLGENGPVAVDPKLLESSAFISAKDDFYAVEQTQSEPLKGNFTNVARCRLSGTLLGPTNHHSYQPQLRSLYEQRFSRRMSFPDYQRQIEVVSDPAVVEQWKEQARSVTTYVTKAEGEEAPVTFNNIADAERHFRQTHLPALLRSAPELTISGVVSRRLQDRGLGRVIEDAWAAEIRSPSKMMQELAGGLREAGLNIFRHRRGMLFVSPIRIRSFGHDRSSVSVSINRILEKLTEHPGIKRKELAEKMAVEGAEPAAAERTKMMLVSDLRWLISEGYVMEFNDGTLDLPRPKAPAPVAANVKQVQPSAVVQQESVAATEELPSSEMEPNEETAMSVEQSIEPQPSPEAAPSETSLAPEQHDAPEGEEPDQAPPTTLTEGAVPSPS